MSQRAVIDRPFIGGMNTDQPDHQLDANETTVAQDLIAPEGIARQRKGWSYDGTTADASNDLVAFARHKFALADDTKSLTMTAADTGDSNQIKFYVHNPSSAGTALEHPDTDLTSDTFLPRAIYRDEVLWCHQPLPSENFVFPMLRYSGSEQTTVTPSGTSVIADNEAEVTGGTYSSAPAIGSFCRLGSTSDADTAHIWPRVVESETTLVTLEDYQAKGAHSNDLDASTFPFGYTYPCVNVYSAGTLSVSSGTATGNGVEWQAADVYSGGQAFLLTPSSGNAHLGVPTTPTSAQSFGTNLSDETETTYQVLARCPFTDVAVHGGSLFGTGNPHFPSRVYVGPPGWNLAYPPGFELPADTLDGATSSNANDFLMDFVDVPSAYDGDKNVALLSSPNPLLIFKRAALYGIYGDYPNFALEKIEDHVGCIDLRSAFSVQAGQFWAGEEGIYMYASGQVIDLTMNKINREWRSLTDGFDYGTSDYCTMGEVYDHLFVHITTDGGTAQRTYVYDLNNQSWISRFTNHNARYFFASQVDGESEELYWVGDDDQGRVMKSAEVVNGTGTAKDDDTTSPRMQATTGSNLGGSIEEDRVMLDMAVHANIVDAGAAGSTAMDVSTDHGGGLGQGTSDTSTAVMTINSDTVDRVDRHEDYTINTTGRRHSISVDVDTTGTDTAATKAEVHRIEANFIDMMPRT